MEKFQELLNPDYMLNYVLKSLFSITRFCSSLSQPFAFSLYEIVITKCSFKNRFLCVLDVAGTLFTGHLLLDALLGLTFNILSYCCRKL